MKATKRGNKVTLSMTADEAEMLRFFAVIKNTPDSAGSEVEGLFELGNNLFDALWDACVPKKVREKIEERTKEEKAIDDYIRGYDAGAKGTRREPTSGSPAYVLGYRHGFDDAASDDVQPLDQLSKETVAAILDAVDLEAARRIKERTCWTCGKMDGHHDGCPDTPLSAEEEEHNAEMLRKYGPPCEDPMCDAYGCYC